MKTPRRWRCLAPIVFASLSAALLRASEPGPAASATNELGADLFHQLAAEHPGQNLLFSPFSIQSALALAYSGAAGETKAEMARVLHFPPDDAALPTSFGALRAALEETADKSVKRAADIAQYGHGTVEVVEWHLANRLFGQPGYPFRNSFLTLLRDGYQAPLEQLDFRANAESARTKINSWVEEQTKRKIRDLIPAGGVNARTRLVLVNALYLKAPWQNDFSIRATKPRPFALPENGAVDVPTMVQTKYLGYEKRDGFTALTLPYLDGDLQFLILLPDKPDGADALGRKLTAALLTDCARIPAEEIVLYLPKFRLKGMTLPLAKMLQTLGMKGAFDQPTGSANFDRIAPRRSDDYLALTDVFHQAFLALDEHGTEASAATAVTMMAFAATIQRRPPPEVHVDHPFLFAIQHRESGACLFLGRVSDPR